MRPYSSSRESENRPSSGEEETTVPDQSAGSEVRYDLLLEYFKSLRSEILQTQNSRLQFGVWKFGAISFLLGIFFNKSDAGGTPSFVLVLLRLLPLLSLLFDLMYISEIQRGIAQIGEFIANVIEKEWFKDPLEKTNIVLWEGYLRRKDTKNLERVSPTQVMLLFTLILFIFGVVVTGDYSRLNFWTFYWLGLLLFFAWIARPVFIVK